MQLYYAPTSPFSRKVRVILRELGLEKQISEILIDPWTDEALRAHNPLSKVPTLILEDGMAVFESAVICDYLDQLAKSRGISEGVIPESGPGRLSALKWQGLADGMMAATGRLYLRSLLFSTVVPSFYEMSARPCSSRAGMEYTNTH